MPSAVASRYANALADAVLASGTAAPESLDQLRAFDSMSKASADLRNVLLSPAVSNTRKRAVISRFAQAIPLSPIIRNFLFVLIDRRRTGILDDIAQAYETALDQRMGIVRAEVRSAAALTDHQQSELQRELSRVSNKQVRCDFMVDPSLIGGVVARIGSTVYDGSVRTQLESLRERLIAR
jgi:F-type H+-transporting ATPase subunit delta